MSIKKQYLKKKPICKVTFKVSDEKLKEAESVSVVGEFNNWSGTPMKKLKNKTFSQTINLEKGKEYEFRYLVDKKNWKNDAFADKEVSTIYPDAKNSVIIV